MSTSYDTWLEGNCGIDDAEEARGEAIEARAAELAAGLIGSEDFAWGALVDLGDDAKNSILQDVGKFFERVNNLPGGHEGAIAAEAIRLWRELHPTIEAAAKAQATEEATTELDKAEADMPSSAAEYRRAVSE